MNYKWNNCNKSYKHRQSLFRHKNKCNNTNNKYNNSNISVDDDVSLKMCSPSVAQNKKIYKSVSKIELIEELIHERTNDIREFMEYNINELNAKIIKRLNVFIDKLDTNRLYLKKKCNELKTLVYDNTKHIDINKFNLLQLEWLSNNTT